MSSWIIKGSLTTPSALGSAARFRAPEITFLCTAPDSKVSEITIVKCNDTEYYIKIVSPTDEAYNILLEAALSKHIPKPLAGTITSKLLLLQTSQKNVLGTLFQIVQSIQPDFAEIREIISDMLSLNLSDEYIMPDWVVAGDLTTPSHHAGFYNYSYSSMEFTSTKKDTAISSMQFTKHINGEYNIAFNLSCDIAYDLLSLRFAIDKKYLPTVYGTKMAKYISLTSRYLSKVLFALQVAKLTQSNISELEEIIHSQLGLHSMSEPHAVGILETTRLYRHPTADSMSLDTDSPTTVSVLRQKHIDYPHH